MDFSLSRRGENNPCKKISKEKWKEIGRKVSIKLKERIKNGTFTPCVTNSWANSRVKIKLDGFDALYRSSWEAAFQILNPICKYEKLRVGYTGIDNKWHNYIVDFIDEASRIVYEIKPKSFMRTEINQLKAKSLNEWCIINNYTCQTISNEWFKNNANKIDYTKYDEKLYKGMKQFLK